MATLGDMTGLDAIETRIRARLVKAAASEPLAWAADQIGMAEIMLARHRLGGVVPTDLGLILGEAAMTAREMGVDALADRAEALLRA